MCPGLPVVPAELMVGDRLGRLKGVTASSGSVHSSCIRFKGCHFSDLQDAGSRVLKSFGKGESSVHDFACIKASLRGTEDMNPW